MKFTLKIFKQYFLKIYFNKKKLKYAYYKCCNNNNYFKKLLKKKFFFINEIRKEYLPKKIKKFLIEQFHLKEILAQILTLFLILL